MGSDKAGRPEEAIPATEPDSPCAEGTADERFRGACLRYLPALYAMALRLTRNGSDAEDLVQETYLKAVRSAASFDPCSDCKAWLFKIMTNTFIDEYRKKAKAPLMVELVEGGKNLPEEARRPEWLAQAVPHPEEEVLANILDDDIAKALDALPERYRVPILLFDVEGFSYAEIADMLNIPVGTVMSRLYRGRRLLKTALVDYARSHGYKD